MHDTVDSLIRLIGSIILGKDRPIRLAVSCLLARGHLLIEDVPGVGKTTLGHSLAASVGLQFRRIQFTSDLLPADIVGNSIFDRESGRFVFHQGPLFTQVLLADEINRATPKTQSALLEAMEEHHVTVDGITHTLPEPFFVIATQNPQRQLGTFPLPESQLDRFLMRISLGVPDRSAEREMLLGRDRRELLRELVPAISGDVLNTLQKRVRDVHVSPALLDYVQDLLQASRTRHIAGLSPRAGLGLLRASQAWALMHRRDMATPEDVQAVGVSVVAHRLEGNSSEIGGSDASSLAQQIFREVAIP